MRGGQNGVSGDLRDALAARRAAGRVPASAESPPAILLAPASHVDR